MWPFLHLSQNGLDEIARLELLAVGGAVFDAIAINDSNRIERTTVVNDDSSLLMLEEVGPRAAGSGRQSAGHRGFSGAFALVIPIDWAAPLYHLLDFNLAVRPTAFFFVLAGTLDFAAAVEMPGYIVFMAGSTSGNAG